VATQPNPAVAAQPDAQQSPYADPAEGILRGDTSITDEDRSALWDSFHGARDANHLAQILQPLVIPNDTKHKLWQAKQATAPVSSNIEKVSAAIQKLSQLDPVTLDIAEKHPIVSKAFIDAAVKPPEAPKAAKEPQGASKSAGKGATAQTKTPLVQPPRIDGMPHLPPIPEGQHRILASDGSIHDIPAENLEKARQIDARLHVLNP
jgi:hypothetical protein